MFNRAELKREVRDTIQPIWFNVFITIFLVSLLISAAASIAGLLSVFTFGLSTIAALILVSLPLSVSKCTYALGISRHENPEMGVAFSGFNNLSSNIPTMLFQSLMLFIWSIPSFIFMLIGSIVLGFSLGSFASGYEYNTFSAENLFELISMSGVSLLIFIISFILLVLPIIKELEYSRVPYLISDHPSLRASEALKISQKVMNGHRWELFVFRLSFILWDLACAVIVPMIYVLPYKEVSMARYHDYIMKLSLENGIISYQDLGINQNQYNQTENIDPSF